jgi:YHS domain-containing protein
MWKKPQQQYQSIQDDDDNDDNGGGGGGGHIWVNEKAEYGYRERYGQNRNQSQDGSMSSMMEEWHTWVRDVVESYGINFKVFVGVLVVGKILFVVGVYILYTTSFGHSLDSGFPVGSQISVECHECPDLVLAANCTDSRYPVLGGLDVVQYFSFDNETMIGTVGSEEYQSTYGDYVYYFLNESNKEVFDTDPEAYMPQFGGNLVIYCIFVTVGSSGLPFVSPLTGFCSWGIGGEYCPKYFWTAECLGPNANWGLWTIYSQKLYFFYLQTAKDLFMENPAYYSEYGQDRWSDWYGSNKDGVMNTRCFYNTTVGFIDSHMVNRTLPDGAPTQDKAEESAAAMN